MGAVAPRAPAQRGCTSVLGAEHTREPMRYAATSCCQAVVRLVLPACLLAQLMVTQVQASAPLPAVRQDGRGSATSSRMLTTVQPTTRESEQVEPEEDRLQADLEIESFEVVPRCSWVSLPPSPRPVAVDPVAAPMLDSRAEASNTSRNCTMNSTWAEERVFSQAARMTVRRASLCWSRTTRLDCAAERFCNWLEDEGTCDMSLEDGTLNSLLSSMPKQGILAGKEVSTDCGFAGELWHRLMECEAVSEDGSCPSHCYESKAQCSYRSGACDRLRRCSLNSSRFWHDTCGSDVGEQCGLTIGAWSWAWPRAGHTSEEVVSCMQRHCPTAARFYRNLFSVQELCSGLNASECHADATCFTWDALNASICEASPEALAPMHCGFGEMDTASWRCNRRNRTACTGDCQYIEGGTCWHNDLVDICIGSPSKVPLHMSHRPGKCSMSSAATLRVLAEALQEHDLRELALLAQHEATCNNQSNAAACADIPTVTGQLQMNVSSPDAFVHDRVALDAVAKAIAAMASVPRDAVIVKLTVLAESRGLAVDVASDVAEDTLRRASVALDRAGQVNADYTIMVPAGRNAMGMADALSSTDTAVATAVIIKALEENNLEKRYMVEVRHIQANFTPRTAFPVANSVPISAKLPVCMQNLLTVAFLSLVALV